jgi:hypothetical protein
VIQSPGIISKLRAIVNSRNAAARVFAVCQTGFGGDRTPAGHAARS